MKRLLFIVLIAIMTASSASAQYKRELKTESNGFQWYMITDGKYRGAQDIIGKTLIPLDRDYTFIHFHKKSTVQGVFSIGKAGVGNGACDINGR